MVVWCWPGQLIVTDLEVLVSRLTTSGALDPTFGVSGHSVVTLPGNNDAQAVTVDALGRILVVGTNNSDANSQSLRLNANGSLSTTWGVNGVVNETFDPAASDRLFAVLVDAQYRVTMVGGGGTVGGVLVRRLQAQPPSAPLSVVATPGNTTASVAFQIPAQNGGSAILGYEAISSPGGLVSGGCASSPCSVTGLTNGTAYTFTVRALNDEGFGPASAPSAAVTPQAPQTITFGVLADRVYTPTPFAVSATGGGSGQPVTFSSSTNPVCTSSGTNGTTITLVGVGTCTLTAQQAGSAAFSAAAPRGCAASR
jgi:hypothetical protein